MISKGRDWKWGYSFKRVQRQEREIHDSCSRHDEKFSLVKTQTD